MNPNPKIRPEHLERQAVIYIRQSTMRQVEENLESQDLQYQLVQRAQALGWAEHQVTVIDDDLGKSAISSSERTGFQALVAAVGLGQVGMILVTDVSRLARNCGDWYRLLDLASLCDTLLCDAAGLYNPRLYDDRLLLGLKGTFAEAQWHNMRSQLCAAQMNKARRGELHTRLPVGLERLDDDRVIFTPDQQVQDTLRLVFTQFERLGSVGKLLRFCRDEDIRLPRRSGKAITWNRASYAVLYHILKQPAYAGTYTYGKRHRTRIPGEQGKVVVHNLPFEEWPVVLHDTLPAYITWEQFLANQERLHQNAQGASWTCGAPRLGAALLQGIVLCARCGRPMHVHYTHSPHYICDFSTRQFADRRCQSFTLAHIDPVISQLVLEAVQPARIEAAIAACQQAESQRQAVVLHWQQRRERASYETELARRRYEAVDPTNRLVAAALERLWEEKLTALDQVERDWRQFQGQEAAQRLSQAEQDAIRHLANDLPALWQSPTTTQDERKRLLRLLIQDVTLDSVSAPGFSVIHVRWRTGAITTRQVPRPKGGTPPATHVAARLRQLAQAHPDHAIADILNAEAFPTATGLPWTTERVRAVRRKHKIPTACPDGVPATEARGDGLIKASEAARRLDVHPSMISNWFRQGFLSGSQRGRQSPLWVLLTPEIQHRLDGSASLSPDLIPLLSAPSRFALTSEQIHDMIRAGQFSAYRIRVGRYWRWFIQPTENPTGCAQ